MKKTKNRKQKPVELAGKEVYLEYLAVVEKAKRKGDIYGVVYEYRHSFGDQGGEILTSRGRIELKVDLVFEILARWGPGKYRIIIRDGETMKRPVRPAIRRQPLYIYRPTTSTSCPRISNMLRSEISQASVDSAP